MSEGFPYPSLPRIGAALLLLALAGRARGQSAESDLRRPAAGRYDVVALRVEFRPDTTRFTTGDGTFGGALFDTLRPSIDPPPHDAGYFRAHLSFLEHYVETVSGGATRLETHLVPEVVRLPERMARYSPTGPDAEAPEERKKMALLVRDAWARADRRSTFDMSGFDPDRTALILFHAGAGRDVELVGTSLRKTPEDLPSLYLGVDRLDAHLEERPRFDGFRIDHTIVLPETETRIGDDPISGDPYLAEFSLNGLMAASFFNYLGVPDLFDTGSGRTGIGPFGLMDPMGIFAYRGLFPPEPSAWTKWFLGWIEAPVRRPESGGRVRLRAAAATRDGGGTGDGGGGPESDRPHAAVRVPVAPGEYFLLENRHRDPGGDGLQLTVWEDGTTRTLTFDRSEEALSRFSAEAFPGGVVTGASDYDWAIPGAPSEADSLLLGGTAVWHVDESRIRAGLATNRVNADPERRGVDLEEADGAQDLGMEASGLLGTGAERGTAFDLYYRGNPARVVTREGETIRLYENRFGPETRPSSASNGGGPSFVTLEKFSEVGRIATVRLARSAAAGISPIEGWHGRRLSGRFAEGAELLLPPEGAGDRGLYAVEDSSASGRRLIRIPHPAEDDSVRTLTERVRGRPVWAGSGWAALVDEEDAGWAMRLPGGGRAVPSAELRRARPVGDPIVLRQAENVRIHQLVEERDAARSAVLVRIESDGDVRVEERYPGLRGVRLARYGPGVLAVIGAARVRTWPGESSWSLGGRPVPEEALFGKDASGRVGLVPDVDGNRISWLDRSGETRAVRTENLRGEPVLADLDGDGYLDVLASRGFGLRALTREGALVEEFPVLGEIRPVGQPLVFAGGERLPSIVVAARDGYLHGVRPGGPGERRGFPLPIGGSGTRAIAGRDSMLAAIAPDGTLRAWRWSAGGRPVWGQRGGNAFNHRFVAVAGSAPGPADPAEGLIRPDRSYVWPNPLRGGPAHVRLVCRRRCSVDVTVVDMAGMQVDRLVPGEQRGGIPRDLSWEADVGSGVYYLRVRARGPDGRTDTVLLRMAVVR